MNRYKFSPVREIPRASIRLRPDLFQGREHAYAEETVQKILREGYDKSQEPIVVWEDKNQDPVVISGHSRFEASGRLLEAGDSTLENLPVKFFLGDAEGAMDYALLESNRSGTSEGLKSDLAAYRRAREKGYNREYLMGLFKPERRLKLLEDLRYLNPKGIFLEYLDSDSEKHFPYLERNARWVGQMREQLPKLTHGHERELFFFLYPNEGGKTSKLEITKDKFFDRVSKAVLKIDFDPSAPLNLEHSVSTSAFTDPVKEKIREIEKEIEGYDKRRLKLDEKISQARGAGDQGMVNRFSEKQKELSILIQRALEEKQKLEADMGELEKSLGMDLFSSLVKPEEEAKELVEQEQKPEEEKPNPLRDLERLVKLLSRNAWFELFPDKVLGEEHQTTDKFNKPVTEIRGKWSEVKAGIDVSEAHLPELPNEDDSDITLTPAKRENLARVISMTESQQAEATYREALGLESDPETYLDFEEVRQNYNPAISDEEIRAWVWGEYHSGKMPYLSSDSGWRKYLITPEEETTYRNKWLSEGIVCYYRGEYLISPLYYAESITERLSELEADKDRIILLHGEDQYARQLEGLQRILPPRLTLDDPEVGNRLVLNPWSNFVKHTRISALADGQEFTTTNDEGRTIPHPIPLLTIFEKWLKVQSARKFEGSTPEHIKQFFIENKRGRMDLSKAEKSRIRQRARRVGPKLFAEFLAREISEADRLAIEKRWNETFNSWVEVNYHKIPAAFTLSRTFKNKPLFIREAQREGVGFISARGNGCIAYDVGLGKTMTAILSLGQALESGRCRRPLIVVPNSTYQNWLSEIRGRVEDGKIIQSGILPQYPVNDLFNLSEKYLSQVRDESDQFTLVPNFSITVLTYEGFSRLGFDPASWDIREKEFFAILNQGIETNRERASLQEKIGELTGRGMAGGLVPIEALGFDYMVIDEAHSAKKSFTRVRGEITAGKRSRSPYAISSGEPSSMALRAFMVARYIQSNSPTGNVLLLTATPFTNSPLEIYSMLALIAYPELARAGINNLKTFFDTFIHTSHELVINARLQPERREVVLGFNNLVALRQLIRRFINYKTGEEAGITRPNKIVLPRSSEDPDERISTNLQPSVVQSEYMARIESYVREEVELVEICPDIDPPKEEEDSARTLRAIGLASQVALSPWLFSCENRGKPTAKEYVEESPKISYAVKCIESVRDHARENELEMPGQVIYMNSGVQYFPLVVEYLVEYSGFSKTEVAIIDGSLSAIKKEAIKNRFLSGEVKVLIGSASIREGINLQYRATDLYVLWLDWNPTDVKQLEGRIWRQGNRYENVRIVFPLVENSIDIFKFQKLQEKTGRINEIWEQQGRRNTLDLEEFNPAELKEALITDPEGLAELLVIRDRETLQDEIDSLRELKRSLKRHDLHREFFTEHYPAVQQKAREYKPERNKPRGVESNLAVYRDWIKKHPNDALYNDTERLKRTRKAWRVISRGIKEVLHPHEIEEDFILSEELERVDAEIELQGTILNDKTGSEAVLKIANRIREKRAARKEEPVSIEGRVREFARLNEMIVGRFMVTPKEDPVLSQITSESKAIAKDEDEMEAIEQLLRDLEEMDRMIEELKKMEAA